MRDSPPVAATAVHYACRALPVLGFVGSMFSPAVGIDRLGRDNSSRLLRFPAAPSRTTACAVYIGSRWRPLFAVLDPGTEMARPLPQLNEKYDVRQVRAPITLHLADAAAAQERHMARAGRVRTAVGRRGDPRPDAHNLNRKRF